MTPFYFFAVYALLFVTLLLFAYLIKCFIFINILSHIKNKIKIMQNSYKNYNHFAIMSLCWIGICIVNYILYTDTDRLRADAYLLLLIAYILVFISFILRIVFEKYIYVTSEGIITLRMYTKIILNKNSVHYSIDDNTLSFYYKNRKNPMNFEMIERKDELIKMLEENYLPYTKTVK